MLTIDTIICRLARAARRFPAARRANVAITFALSLIPVVGLTGAAIDFSHANSVKADMQSALDSAALMVSKTAATMSASQIQTAADGYFKALFTRPEATNIKVTTSYANNGGSSMVVSGSADMNTDFMGVLGYKTITVTSSATAKWGSTRLRVALVLDNTGSMSQAGKIGALKTATTNLLTQLQNAVTTNGDVYVSIVPFVKDVNAGAANYPADWIDWTGWSAAPNNSTPGSGVGPGSSCPYNSYSNGFTCLTAPASGATTSTVPSSGTYKGYICPSTNSSTSIAYNGCYTSATYSCTGSSCTCTGHNNCSCSGSGSSLTCKQPTGYYEHAWVVNPTSTWNGCVTDRGSSAGPVSDYDRLTTAPVAGIPDSLFAAEQYTSCPQTVMGLSYDWTAMTTEVNNMVANGTTNQPIGLVWGWQSLVGGGPFSVPAEDPNFQYKKVIILLTDGLNTQDRWYGNGSNISTQVDYRMYDANGNGTCANIKAAGITIYTIQVNTGGDPTSTLLENCATDPTKFFLLTSANQIVTTFNQIGTNLTQLRIAQ